MRERNEKEILEFVKDDYNKSAEEFNFRRQTAWKDYKYYLPYIKDNFKVADIGCGNGRLYKFIPNKEKIYYLGVDNSKKLLNIAKKNHPVEFKLANAYNTKLKNNYFDITFLIATLHHIPSKKLREKTIGEMKRITKKNGYFVISVWNLYRRKFIKYFIKSFFASITSFFLKSRKDLFIPWGNNKSKRYFYALRKKELETLLIKNNFRIIKKIINKNITFICKKT